MKTTIIILTVLLTATFAKAEGLNSNASYIKKNYPSEYEKTLKKHALAEWKDDFSMVVYEINKQADALIELIDEFESDNTNIEFKAIQEWSIDGYKSSNITKFTKRCRYSSHTTRIKTICRIILYYPIYTANINI